MESLDLQSNLETMENTEFEEKVDIDDLVLPSKPIELKEIGIDDFKKEPLEEKEQIVAFESDHNIGKNFQLEMEENILGLYEELDKERSENSMMDFGIKRSLKIRQFVEKTFYDKTKELKNIKEELQRIMVTNQELLGKVQVLEMNNNTFKINALFEKNLETKPFSCKSCGKAFFQIHEVKEHCKIHNSISEIEDLRNQPKSLKTHVEKLEVNLKSKKLIKVRSGKAEIKSKRKKVDFVCEICNVKFAYKQGLERHIIAVHEGKRAFKCDSCGKSFQAKQVLQNHTNSVHEKKKFPCSYCDRILSRRDKKIAHEMLCPKKQVDM